MGDALYDGPRTLGALLEHRAAQRPGHEFVRFHDHALSYATLDVRANRVANALRDLALATQDKVAVLLPNGAEFLAVWFGIARAGLVEVPLNVGLRGDLLAYVLNQTECKVLVVSDEWAPRVEAVADSLHHLRCVVVVGESEIRGLATMSLDELMTADPATPPVVVDPHDHSVIVFTSGTTGPSKGVVLSHNSNFQLSTAQSQVMEYNEDETFYTVFPLFHTSARYTSVLTAMLLDQGTVVLHEGFSASRFWDICREEGVTVFSFLGSLLMMLIKQPERPSDSDNPVRTGYGAPLPVTVAHEFERRFGVVLCEIFGSTESGLATANRPSERRLGSCGKPLPYYEMEIHDGDDHAVPHGGAGEIVIRPRQADVLFSRYYGMPEETLVAFRNLWFHTGDRGYRDDEGWFYFVDRMKDAIRRRGENISSWEVEQVLNDHPWVQETAVVGVPSPLTEEEVLAVVKLRGDRALAPEALLDFAQARLPHFAVPRYVRFVDELPKNPQQRVQKVILREAGTAEGTWDREAAGYVVER